MDNEKVADAYTREVAKLLTDAKIRSGKSFDQLAVETDLSRPTVVRLLAGERHITLMYLRALCSALNLDAGTLLDDASKNL